MGIYSRNTLSAVPKHGVLNLHSGRLPDYKGVMATFWALLNDEKEIGTTLHYIDDCGIDTGRVITTTSMTVDRNRSYLWHVLGLYDAGCRSVLSAIQQIRQGGEVPSNTAA